MAKDKIKPAICKICHNVLASNQVLCGYCGAPDPIKKKEPSIWPWVVAFLIFLVLLLNGSG